MFEQRIVLIETAIMHEEKQREPLPKIDTCSYSRQDKQDNSPTCTEEKAPAPTAPLFLGPYYPYRNLSETN